MPEAAVIPLDHSPGVSLGQWRDIWSVSRLTAEVAAVLGGSFPLLWVQGELSNLSQPASGHLYFTLKDSAAQVRCAMFRPKRRLLGFTPANGQQVLLRARVGLYEPRGDFQLLCEHMEPAGEGALRVELEARKRRLAAAGLFDAAAKRPLPALPRQVGLITSPSGAAVRDLITVLGRRLPLLPVLIFPTPVQGDGAAPGLVAALARANARGDCDVLILARGGGALEDLMAFNDEALAHAIRASRIPVVTGIGHEIDVTIADLAADRRAATPSAAAELVAPDRFALAASVATLAGRLRGGVTRRLTAQRQRVGAAARGLRLLHPAARLHTQAQRLDDLERALTRAVARRLDTAAARLANQTRRLASASPAARLALQRARLIALVARLGQAGERNTDTARARLLRAIARLDALSPLATLTRGYAVVTDLVTGRVLRDATRPAAGTRLLIRPAVGSLIARVEAAGSAQHPIGAD